MNVCRLCDAEIKSGSFENIFNENLYPPLWKIIADLANLTILESDPFTNIVCFQCFDQLEKFHIFRRIILHTNWKNQHRNEYSNNNNRNNNDNTGRLLENVDYNNSNDCLPIETESDDYILKEEIIEIEENCLKIEDPDAYISIDENFNNCDSNDTEIIHEIDRNDLVVNVNRINNDCHNSKVRQFVDKADYNFNDGQRSSSPIDVGSDDYSVLVEEEETREIGMVDNGTVNNINTTINNGGEEIENDVAVNVDGEHNYCRRKSCSPFEIGSDDDIVLIVEEAREIENQINDNLNNKPISDDNVELTDDSDTVDNGTINNDNTTINNGNHENQNGKTSIEAKVNRNQEHLNPDERSTHNPTKTKTIKKLATSKSCNNNNRYQCDVCKKTFSHQGRFNVHLRTHTGDILYQCNFCGKEFLRNYDLKLHLSSNNTIGRQCNICDQTFSTKCTYRKHLKEHLEPDKARYQCYICNKTFSSLFVLVAHRKIHTGQQSYKCKNCNRKFSYKSALDQHLLVVHSGKELYKCTMCSKKFPSKRVLNAHSKVHSVIHQCDICEKKFPYKSKLLIHMNQHTGEKPLKCNIYDKTVAPGDELTRHSKEPTDDEKPYKCNICGKRFTRTSALKQHLNVHTGEKRFKCNICGIAFKHSGNLKPHIRVHTGEKRFKCNICDKTFARSGNLKLHLRFHTGEKPFKCDICDKRFTLNGDLKRHLTVHTSEKAKKCNVCCKTFSHNSYLQQHLIKSACR